MRDIDREAREYCDAYQYSSVLVVVDSDGKEYILSPLLEQREGVPENFTDQRRVFKEES